MAGKAMRTGESMHRAELSVYSIRHTARALRRVNGWPCLTRCQLVGASMFELTRMAKGTLAKDAFLLVQVGPVRLVRHASAPWQSVLTTRHHSMYLRGLRETIEGRNGDARHQKSMSSSLYACVRCTAGGLREVPVSLRQRISYHAHGISGSCLTIAKLRRTAATLLRERRLLTRDYNKVWA